MTLLPDVDARTRPAPAKTFAEDLSRHGDRPAIVAGAEVVTYAGLEDRVERMAERLGSTRRLIVIEATNDLDPIVAYLAGLRRGHPVLLAPPGRPDALRRVVDVYDPDVVVAGGDLDERRRGSVHELHPDLALLLSTSGSTGSSKVVRLSHTNLQSNAEAIAAALEIDEDDRAITSLPLGYCYGLSVLHSHLVCGASIVLSDASVLDAPFWERFRRYRATTFAGVPHTFELLDRIGFDELRLPSLRAVTQAGGRLDTPTVRRYAALGRRDGWDFHVMYGQTEATARMACLAPALAADHPSTIGTPIAGGALALEPIDGDAGGNVGELVYRGPNVMLGYACGPSDLALGRTVHELHTGDLARVDGASGLYEIVGRRHRFVKPFGLRIDLDGVERALRDRGIDALCAGDDRRVVVAAPGAGDDVVEVVRDHTGLPVSAITVHTVDALPRLDNGKPDHAALLALPARPPANPTDVSPGTVGQLYAAVLGLAAQEIAEDDDFVGLGGDSLSYVELSVRLEELLGALPDDWPAMPIRDVEAAGTATAGDPTRIVRWVETTVVLRAAAVGLIVATHTGFWDLRGGAHVLLAIAGWNFSRFQLPATPARLARSIGRIAVPTVAWIALLFVVTDDYALHNLLLLHDQIGPDPWDPRWRFWFVEALVQLLVVVGGGLCVPAVRRLEQRRPFAFATSFLVLALAYALRASGDRVIQRPQTIAWVFVLGWAAHRAQTTRQRLAISAISIVGAHLFFVDPERQGVVAAGMLLLIWVRTVPLVRPVHRIAGMVAAASLWIYLVQWQVYPAVLVWATPIAATVASLAAGVAVHALTRMVVRPGRV